MFTVQPAGLRPFVNRIDTVRAVRIRADDQKGTFNSSTERHSLRQGASQGFVYHLELHFFHQSMSNKKGPR